jgi:hypothetical protein
MEGAQPMSRTHISSEIWLLLRKCRRFVVMQSVISVKITAKFIHIYCEISPVAA